MKRRLKSLLDKARPALAGALGRPPGISVLVATKDEQFVAGLSIRSFLDFADEIIVVDNGSTDATCDIVRQLELDHPDKIRFFHRPELPDLHHNRAFALRQSRYDWVVRADSDYVCYAEGPLSILQLREFLLSMRRGVVPEAVLVPQTNVFGDFRHTGTPMRPGGYRENPERAYVLDVESAPMPRFYRWHPGFAFVRSGRRETTRWLRHAKTMTWPTPVWMHCTIKSDLAYFQRSERSNWRQLGDFARYPTLDAYIRDVVLPRLGTRDVHEAAEWYVRDSVYPYLEPYERRGRYPYPELVRRQLEKNPMFEVVTEGGTTTRRFLGFEALRDGVGR